MNKSQFTFESFIKSKTNDIALYACKAVCADTDSYNPLWIYGKADCGKTHLLNAVYSELVKKGGIYTLFVRAKDMANIFIDALHGNNADWLCVENCNVLIVDNIEYFLGRPTLLHEFGILINKKTKNGQGVIFASDCAPCHLDGLAEILREIDGSLIVDIQPSDTALKIDYIKEYMSRHPFDIDDNALEYIIKNCKSVTQLRGVLISADFYSTKFKKRIDLDWIKGKR